MSNRRGIVTTLWVIFLSLAINAGPPLPQAAIKGRPNIICVLVDDLGYGDLSSHGAKDIRTPNIDALASAGMRLDRFYANSTVCSPTRAALLTGRYPDLVGVPGVIRTDPLDTWGYLSPRATTLPQVLKRSGYRTALIGKWHLGLESPNLPGERGFEHFRGFLGDMMDDYYSHLRHNINYMRQGDRVIDPQGHATDLFTDWTIEYLNQQRGGKRPFFIYLAYNAPHVPLQPPPEWIDRVRKREPDIPEQRLKLAALIEHMDHSIGRIVEVVKATGQYENTLMVFASDNGGQLNVGASSGGLRGGKEDLYEGGIRVPMFAVWPLSIRAGARSESVAVTMDLFATFCEAAGAAVPPGVDGVSILPLLTGKAGPPVERDIVWMRREGGTFYNGRDYYALRRGDWKLVQRHPFAPFELYNLKSDPAEQTNLAAENRKVFNELTAALRAHLQKSGAVPWQKPVSDIAGRAKRRGM